MKDSIGVAVKYFVFAEVVGFEQLPNRSLGHFLTEFLGGLADCIHESEKQWLDETQNHRNQLMMVFDDAECAGTVALRMQKVADDRVPITGESLALQIRIHGGPVVTGINPVTKKRSFLGGHGNCAANIDSSSEGILVSHEYAALCAFEGVSAFNCIPQGLAKFLDRNKRIKVYRLQSTND